MNVLRPACYRLTVTLRRRWAGYLGLVLIIGLTGGVALGAAAAARRTESSFPVFLASTNPSELTVQYSSQYAGELPPFARVVGGLPLLRHAESAVEPVADVLGPDGAPRRPASPRVSGWHSWRASTACTSIRTGSACSPGGWPIRPAATRS